MTTYTVRYALYDQAYDVGGGYYWTWKDKNLTKDSLIRFYNSISGSVPMNANAIRSDEIRSGHREFEGQYVIYRYYNGGRDRGGRPNRCVVLTAWLQNIEGQTGGIPALSEDEVNKILQLPTFKKLENTTYAQLIPIPAPWVLSEQFPSEAEVLQNKYDLLVEQKTESENRLRSEIEGLKQTKKNLESNLAGLQSEISSLKTENDRLKSSIVGLQSKNSSLTNVNNKLEIEIVKLTKEITSLSRSVTYCKFVGWIPPKQLIVENFQPVDVSYEIEIYNASESHLTPLRILKISAIDEYGNATLEKEIAAESLMKHKIEIKLVRRIPQYDYQGVVKKWKLWLWFIPYLGEVIEPMTSPKGTQFLLIPGEPTDFGKTNFQIEESN